MSHTSCLYKNIYLTNNVITTNEAAVVPSKPQMIARARFRLVLSNRRGLVITYTSLMNANIYKDAALMLISNFTYIVFII
jgi:hypothetical protein